jgi:signal transduction histidine kinase
MSNDVRPETNSPKHGLVGGGEMGERTRAFDWSETPVGPIEAWPQSLKTAVSICLGSRSPMVIWWGEQALTQFFNDAYIPFLGASKLPSALGQSGRECWSEIWAVLGPMLEGVFATGAATWSEDFLYVIDRNLPREEGYFTFSYSPIWDEAGTVGGIFCACYETTGRVIGERRLKTLRDLGERRLDVATSVDEAVHAAALTLGENPKDVPFALVYLLDEAAARARLAEAIGLERASAAAPEQIEITGVADVWGLGRVLTMGTSHVVGDLTEQFGRLPAGVWADDETTQAVVLPLAKATAQVPAGFLVAGISPRRPFDDEYHDFLALAAGHIATAISNARALEHERQRAKALAEIDRAKTAFFSNVSHEFRTPLTLMLGPIEDALGEAGGADTPERERLELIHRNGVRLLRLVNTLLDFARVEAGRVDASYEPTDLAVLTADLASLFRSAVERADLEFVVECPPLPEPIWIDRDMWEKIVSNLVSNAIKFTFEGRIEVRLAPAVDAVEFMVRDTGTGIGAEDLPHLFERFRRVAGARGRTHEGTGIGLALVHELVRLHGGSVHATSELGVGTAFVVSIPTGTAHLPADCIGRTRALPTTATGIRAYVEDALRWLPGTSAAPTLGATAFDHEIVERSAPGARARVLVADDNMDMREYIGRLLADIYDVEVVGDGEAVLAAVGRQLPDVILSDVMMPRLDGFGLLRALREEERTRAIPVILLSARAGEEARHHHIA